MCYLRTGNGDNTNSDRRTPKVSDPTKVTVWGYSQWGSIIY